MKKSSRSDYESERQKWSTLVGKFILSFGDIENVTYLALLQLPKDKIFETTSRLGFAQRTDLVLELVAGHPEVPDALKETFSKYLSVAKTLSEVRNLVAHSPLMLSFYEHPDEGPAFKKLELGSAKNMKKVISLETLAAAANQSEALAKRIYVVYAKIHTCVYIQSDHKGANE